MPSLSTQGHYFLPICPALVFATERQISRNNRRHNDIKCNVFWVLKILKHKRLGWRTSNEKSWAEHALNWEIQLGDIVRSVILYVPVIHLLALQADLKKEPEPQTSKSYCSCVILSVCANRASVMPWRKAGQNGLCWEKVLSLIFIPAVY